MYDIIAIGAGSGGLNVAGFMNTSGFKTLLIDKSDRSIGGDCLNFGCVPSKALIHISRMAREAQEVQKFGLTVSGEIDITKVTRYVDDKKEIIRTHENADYFRKKGMDVVLGAAEFDGKNSVKVRETVYEGKKIVIATGSRPRSLDLPGIEKVQYFTNENIFDIDYFPKRLVTIGGGPIGMELSQAFRRLGSEVSIIERSSKFLPKEAPEIAEVLKNRLEKEGIQFYFNARLQEFTSSDNLKITVDDKEQSMDFDTVLISIGRVLNIENLQLEKAGIAVDNGKIRADEYLRTTNKNIYVCGDVAGSYQFTHAAELHAGVILNNFFSPLKKKLNNDNLSWVTYTSPEIATFGLNEDELKRRGVDYKKIVIDLKDDDRAIVDDATEGLVILYIAKNKIVGGSMVAEHAGELSQELSLAMSSGLNVKNIFNKTYPYPTAGRINKSAILKHFSGKLTPFVKKVLKFMY